MFRRFVTAAFVLALAVSAQSQTVDEILAKHYEAKGGMDKMKAVKTMRLSGKMTVGPGLEAPFVIEQARPNKMRMDFTFQGLTATQAYDGSTGWMIMPFQGKKDPEPMGEDDLKETAEQADFDGPLVDYKEKGHKVELVGKEPVEGSEAYKLKVTLKNGDVRHYFIDADAYLETKVEAKRTIRGTERESETVLGDYKEVEGMMVPFSIEAGPKGSPQRQKVTVEKVEFNPQLADARFTMPAAAPAAPAAAKPAEKKPEEKKPETTKK